MLLTGPPAKKKKRRKRVDGSAKREIIMGLDDRYGKEMVGRTSVEVLCMVFDYWRVRAR